MVELGLKSMHIRLQRLSPQPLILGYLSNFRDVQQWAELKAASLPKCNVQKRAEGFLGRKCGWNDLHCLFQSEIFMFLKWIHCISIRWTKQFRYNYHISNWAWPLLGHFSGWLLPIKQLHSHDSWAIINNEEKKLGGTCIEQFLSCLKPTMNHKGII